MRRLLFLNNEFINPDMQNDYKLPLQFVRYGKVEGKMYRHYANRGVFTLSLTQTFPRFVYGAMYVLEEWDFYIRLLDAYHMCSLSTLHKNHNRDMHHRIEVDCIPIQFTSLEELRNLSYKEGVNTPVQAYFGNINHPKINQRLRRSDSYNIKSGIDKNNFIKTVERNGFE